MVDVNLLHGTLLTEMGGDSLAVGIQELQEVTRQATDINRAKAYHQLAQTYLKAENIEAADMMLDSMYMLLTKNQLQLYIDIDYEPILNYYIKTKNNDKVEQYTKLMFQEEQMLNGESLKFNLVESIVKLQTEQKEQELKISQLKQANQRLWFLICLTISVIVVCCVIVYFVKQRKQHEIQLKQADEKLHSLSQEIDQLNAEEELRAHEIEEFLKIKDNRHELETLTPNILQSDGESKFRQYFELLYPLFLPRMREKVPSITRREELLCMLIILKLDNKRIADLMAIAPRSVLMLRHRFRQKIGMTTELSLENFIEEILESNNN
jgi:DNA-binding CsgD family transcriptional regulator